nr:MAG TPA: hypothetical protein [Caudoviricetes sp.]
MFLKLFGNTSFFFLVFLIYRKYFQEHFFPFSFHYSIVILQRNLISRPYIQLQF